MYAEIKKNKILVITQCFPCGSWLCIEKILDKLADYNTEIIVLGLGKIFHKNEKFSYFSIPYPRYDRWGFVTTWSPIISFLWNLPLFIIGIFLIIISQPETIVINGLTSGFSMSPFIRLLGKRSIIMFHSHLNVGDLFENFLKRLGNSVDLSVVNSQGSFQNISSVISPHKIIVNEHYANDFFFEGPLKSSFKKPLTLLYVGRLDKDKFCFPLVELARKLKDNKEFLFLFAGVGKYGNIVKSLEKKSANIKYLGYISSRARLRQLYREADVVWSFADETYLGLPAVEALACSTPIIIPKIPALKYTVESKEDYQEIGDKLVPPQIGWLIDPYNPEAILKLFMAIKKKGIHQKMRQQCREYAKLRYSSDNLKRTVKKIRDFFSKYE